MYEISILFSSSDLFTPFQRVDDAIRGGDWNEAAELVHRFLTLDKAVFQLRDANDKGTVVYRLKHF